MSFTAFLAMGGYARFVWPSIGIVLGLLIWNIWDARRELSMARERARRMLIASSPPSTRR